MLLTFNHDAGLGLQESIGQRHVLRTAGQGESIIGRLDLSLVLLGHREIAVLLVHRSLGESVGKNLIAQQPGNIGSRSSITRHARRTEVAVGLVSTSNGGLGDDLQNGPLGRVSHQQVHLAESLVRLDTHRTHHLSVVNGLHSWNLNTTLTILETLSKVPELAVLEGGI